MSDTDTPNGCGVCTAPTATGIHLCRAHLEQLVGALHRAPGLADDLEVTITRQNRTGGQKHGSRSTSRPLPWNEHASICRTELNAIVNAWAYETSQLHEDERDLLAVIHVSDTGGLARWLKRNHDTAATHEQAGDMHAEICDAVTQGIRAVDLPPERKFIGTCKEPLDDGKKCKEELFVFPSQRWITCRNCAHQHDADARREDMLGKVEDKAATTGVLAGMITGLGVPIGSSTIRKYAAQGRLKVISRDRNGRSQYLVGDVLDVFLGREKQDGFSQRSA